MFKKCFICMLLFPAIVKFAPSGAWGRDYGDAIIIDVRTEQEFNAGHISGAINIPYDVIAEKIGEVTTDLNKKIIVYCRSGRRSGIAKNTLEKLGYNNVENGGSLEDMRKRFPGR